MAQTARALLAALVLALALAGPGPAQEAGAPSAAPSAAPAADPADPVGLWLADPGVALEAAAVDLGAFLYLARPLVVFADSPRQPQLLEQLRLLEAGAADLARREVAVIVDSDPAAPSPARQALRPRGFGVVLLDMDGRVLLRRPDPTDARELGRTIDRSPLRREELDRGRAQGSTE